MSMPRLQMRWTRSGSLFTQCGRRSCWGPSMSSMSPLHSWTSSHPCHLDMTNITATTRKGMFMMMMMHCHCRCEGRRNGAQKATQSQTMTLSHPGGSTRDNSASLSPGFKVPPDGGASPSALTSTWVAHATTNATSVTQMPSCPLTCRTNLAPG